MHLLQQHKVLVVWGVSLAAGLIVAMALYSAASAQGLDPALLTGDSRGYVQLAENLLQGRGFTVATTAPFYPESFRTPGYPFFLAALYNVVGSWGAVLFVQAVLLSILPVLLYMLFRRYHERAAFWGSLIFAVEPIRLFYGASLLSDELFACVLLVSLIALQRKGWRSVLAAGVLLGVSMWIRPISLFLPLVYAAWLLCTLRPYKQALLQGLALCVAAYLVVLPWSLRNHARFGSYNISSVGAANLMLYNAPEYLKFAPNPEGNALLAQFKTAQDTLPRQEALSLVRSGVFTHDFLMIIRGHEVGYTFFHLFKTIPFFVTDGLRDTIRLFGVDIGTMPNISNALLHGQFGTLISYLRSGGVAVALFVLGVGFWSTVTLLWLWSVYWALRGRIDRVWLLFAAVILYFALLTGPVSNARYRLPVEGLLLVAALSVVFREKKQQV